MPPVTQRGYNNEFKHEVKSASMPLQEHRISSIPLSASARAKALYGAFPTREGRPPRRPPQCRCRSTVFHLSRSAPLRLCASQGTLWRINPTREGRPPPRPPQYQLPPATFRSALSSLRFQPRPPQYQLPPATFRSALSSLRFQSLCRRAHPRGRDDLRVVRKPSPRQVSAPSAPSASMPSP